MVERECFEYGIDNIQMKDIQQVPRCIECHSKQTTIDWMVQTIWILNFRLHLYAYPCISQSLRPSHELALCIQRKYCRVLSESYWRLMKVNNKYDMKKQFNTHSKFNHMEEGYKVRRFSTLNFQIERGDLDCSVDRIFEKQKARTVQIQENSSLGSKKGRQIIRKKFNLEQKVSMQEEIIVNLRQQLQESQKRLKREISKKEESLGMMTENLQLKNREIEELQRYIELQRCMEVHKVQDYSNILDNSLSDIRLDNKAEILNDKLRVECERNEQNIRQLQKELEIRQRELQESLRKNEQYKRRQFELQQSNRVLLERQKRMDRLQELYNNKVNQMKLYQKRINRNLKNIINQEDEQNKLYLDIYDFHNNSKTQIIFEFIKNIQRKQYSIPLSELRKEEANMLLLCKDKYIRNIEKILGLEEAIKQRQKNSLQEKYKDWEEKEGEVKNEEQKKNKDNEDHTTEIQNSLPEENTLKTYKKALNEIIQMKSEPNISKNLSSSDNIVQIEQKASKNSGLKSPNLRRKSQASIAVEFVHLETENKLKMKILHQMNQKFANIRNVTVEMLKSMDLKEPKKPVKEAIMQLLDMLECSEDEKTAICRFERKKFIFF